MCKIETFAVKIPYTGKNRRVWVYLPSGYANTQQRYPVLYMHDGQNLFDPSTSYAGKIWDAHTAMELLMSEKKTDGIIIVAMDNAGGDEIGRLDEYSPWLNTKLKNMGIEWITRDVGGYGKKYADFLVNQLKPMIDEKYRTLSDRDHTGIAGSSMGGFISLYMGLEYEEVFSKIGAFSSAIWFAEKELILRIEEHSPELKTKWYLDVGTHEDENQELNQLYIQGSLDVYETFLEVGVKEENIKILVEEGGVHDEEAWADRFPDAISWLF